MLPKGITGALLPLAVPFPAALILLLGLAVLPDLSPLHQVPPYSNSLQPCVSQVGGKEERFESASWPEGPCSLGCWDRQGRPLSLPSVWSSSLSQSEQAQTCHRTSTSGEDTVVPIPEVGGWTLVTECRNRAWGLLQVQIGPSPGLGGPTVLGNLWFPQLVSGLVSHPGGSIVPVPEATIRISWGLRPRSKGTA